MPITRVAQSLRSNMRLTSMTDDPRRSDPQPSARSVVEGTVTRLASPLSRGEIVEAMTALVVARERLVLERAAKLVTTALRDESSPIAAAIRALGVGGGGE